MDDRLNEFAEVNNASFRKNDNNPQIHPPARLFLPLLYVCMFKTTLISVDHTTHDSPRQMGGESPGDDNEGGHLLCGWRSAHACEVPAQG